MVLTRYLSRAKRRGKLLENSLQTEKATKIKINPNPQSSIFTSLTKENDTINPIVNGTNETTDTLPKLDKIAVAPNPNVYHDHSYAKDPSDIDHIGMCLAGDVNKELVDQDKDLLQATASGIIYIFFPKNLNKIRCFIKLQKKREKKRKKILSKNCKVSKKKRKKFQKK